MPPPRKALISRSNSGKECPLLVASRNLASVPPLTPLFSHHSKAVKAKGSMKSLEADLLKTAAKEAKDGLVGKAANTMLISASYQEKDEKQLRDKLVTKLKQKAEDREDFHGNFWIHKIRKFCNLFSSQKVTNCGP